MPGQDDIVRSFYPAIAKGDIERALALMEDRIEWINVESWDQPDKNELELLSSFIAQTLTERYGSYKHTSTTSSTHTTSLGDSKHSKGLPLTSSSANAGRLNPKDLLSTLSIKCRD